MKTWNPPRPVQNIRLWPPGFGSAASSRPSSGCESLRAVISFRTLRVTSTPIVPVESWRSQQRTAVPGERVKPSVRSLCSETSNRRKSSRNLLEDLRMLTEAPGRVPAAPRLLDRVWRVSNFLSLPSPLLSLSYSPWACSRRGPLSRQVPVSVLGSSPPGTHGGEPRSIDRLTCISACVYLLSMESIWVWMLCNGWVCRRWRKRTFCGNFYLIHLRKWFFLEVLFLFVVIWLGFYKKPKGRFDDCSLKTKQKNLKKWV